MKIIKIKIALLSVLISSVCFSQKIGYDIMLTKSYRRSIDNSAPVGEKAAVDSLEISAYRLSTSLQYYFPKVNNFEFFATFGYSSVGDEDIIRNGSDLNAIDSTDQEIPYKFYYSRHFHFFDIGGGVNYYLVDNRFKFFLNGTLVGNIPLRGKEKQHDIDRNNTIVVSNVNNIPPNFNMSASFGVGFGYQIGLFALYAKPTYTQMFLPIFSNLVPLDRQYYTYGVSFGTTYSF